MYAAQLDGTTNLLQATTRGESQRLHNITTTDNRLENFPGPEQRNFSLLEFSL